MRQATYLTAGVRRLVYHPFGGVTTDGRPRSQGAHAGPAHPARADRGGWLRGDVPRRAAGAGARRGGRGAARAAKRQRLARALEHEARLASQLDRPCATHIYGFGTEDEGRLRWLAMERVRGAPLDAWLDKHGPLPPEKFAPFFEGLCVAPPARRSPCELTPFSCAPKRRRASE